jgi:hypothetical protein
MHSLLFLFVTVFLLFDAWPVLGGQIPRVNGVLGGVPTTAADTFKKADILIAAATTPGKLRIVANSGICGRRCESDSSSLTEYNFTETTPGVNQASGYADLTPTESIW